MGRNCDRIYGPELTFIPVSSAKPHAEPERGSKRTRTRRISRPPARNGGGRLASAQTAPAEAARDRGFATARVTIAVFATRTYCNIMHVSINHCHSTHRSRLPQQQQRRRQGGRLRARPRRWPAATAHVSLHRLGVLTCKSDTRHGYFWPVFYPRRGKLIRLLKGAAFSVYFSHRNC